MQTEQQKAVGQAAETAETESKTEEPGAAISPKIVLEMPDEARAIITVHLQLEPMGGNISPAERAYLKGHGILVWTTLKLTVTNRTAMCLSVNFHIQAYDDTNEMIQDSAHFIGSLGPHESLPSDIRIIEDIKFIKVVKVLTKDLNGWSFSQDLGCGSPGEDGSSSKGPGMRVPFDTP